MKKYLSFLLLLPLWISCNRSPQSSSVPVVEPEAPDPGKSTYMKYCLACHQTNGSGVPGMFPPLQTTDWVQGDKERLIGLLLNGQQGEIVVNGKPFKGVMPPHAFLTDEQIADVLTFVRSNFGNQADAVTAEEVSRARASTR